MSRRRNPYDTQLWLFKRNTTDTDNHIEDDWNNIGQAFKAQRVGERTRQEKDVLSGRVLQSTTVVVYKTREQLDFDIGDNVADIPNPNEFEQSTIVNIRSTSIASRGKRRNNNPPQEYTLELS